MIRNRTALYWFYAALSGYFALFILLMLWHTVLMPSTRFPVAMMLIVVVSPLLLPLRGLLRGSKKSCSWAAYISLFYFMHGIVEAYVNQGERLYASLEIIFSLLLFFAAIFYVRYAGKP